jgi:hypothetical protein
MLIDEFNEGDLMPWQEMTSRIKSLEAVAHTPGLFPDRYEVELQAQVLELKSQVKTLQDVIVGLCTYTTELQDVQAEILGRFLVGDEEERVVAVHGQCAKCDRVAPLHNGICEGCFYEEIGVV